MSTGKGSDQTPTKKGASPVAGSRKATGKTPAKGGAKAAGTFSGGWKDEDYNEGGADDRKGGRAG